MKYRGLLLPMILAAMCGDDAFVLNTKRGKGMQSTYRREKIVRTEKEFDINGTKVMAYSRNVCRILILQQQRCLYQKVRSIYSKTFTRQRPTNYIIMSWINSDGRGVIRNISQKQNYARC